MPRILRWGTYLENAGRDAADAYYLDLCFQKPSEARRLLGLDPSRDPRTSPVYDAVVEPYRRCPSAHPVQRAMYADLKIYVPNDVLVKVDRMSMLHALEVRCPLLDRRLVEFAFRVPIERKMPGLASKHLLVRLAKSRLPAENLALPKHGFTAPVGRWMTHDLAGRYYDEVLSPHARVGALLDRDVLRNWFLQHRHGAADRSFALWAAWVLERWLENEPAAASIPRPAASAKRVAS